MYYRILIDVKVEHRYNWKEIPLTLRALYLNIWIYAEIDMY